MQTKTKLYFSILMSAIVLTFFLFIQFSKAQTGNLRIYFFDVGQGDSALIRTPEGKDILIDGGPDNIILQRLAEILPFWDREIDMVILTHPHADHIDGLNEVLKQYQVNNVLEPDLKDQPESLIYFNKITDKEKNILANEKIVIESNLEMTFLYPFGASLEEKDLNDASLVFKLSYKDLDFLFVGDATNKVEAKILEENIDSEFLKVGHHGSRYSSSIEFLERVTPLISIISVGEGNSYGHPTKETLDRLSSIDSKVLRTDKNGTIEIEIDSGGAWIIKCSKRCY